MAKAYLEDKQAQLSARAVHLIADLYARQGKVTEARQVIDLLPSFGISFHH